MTGAAPTGDKLYAALDELRHAADVSAPRHAGAWRTVLTSLRLASPRDSEDARQETSINLFRYVRSFEGRSAGEAVRWLRTVHRNRTADLYRVDVRDPVRGALEKPRADADREAPAVERLPAAEPSPMAQAPAALARTTDALFTRLEALLERETQSAAKRELRRVQARAAWLRLVGEEDADAIDRAILPARAPSRDALYKWIERGRDVLLSVIDAWIAELTPTTTRGNDADDASARLVPEALREIIGKRRADAGMARPERRQG